MLSWRPHRLYYVIINNLIKWRYDDNVNSSLLYQLPWNTSSPRHDQDGRKLPWLNHLKPRAGSAVLCGCGCAARLSAVTVGCCLMWLVAEKAPTQSVSLLNRINANSVTFKRKGQNHALFPSYVYTVYTVKSGWKNEDFRIRMNGTAIRNLLPTNHASKTTWRWDAVREFLSLRRLLYTWVILRLETWCT